MNHPLLFQIFSVYSAKKQEFYEFYSLLSLDVSSNGFGTWKSVINFDATTGSDLDHLISYKGLLFSMYNSNILKKHDIGMVFLTNGSTIMVINDKKLLDSGETLVDNEDEQIQMGFTYLGNSHK